MLEVEDEGPGIPPTQQAQVFDRFYRVDGGVTAGSGLGLAIAQGARRADGRGDRARVRGPGATVFRLALPAARASRFSGKRPAQGRGYSASMRPASVVLVSLATALLGALAAIGIGTAAGWIGDTDTVIVGADQPSSGDPASTPLRGAAKPLVGGDFEPGARSTRLARRAW